VGGVWDLVAGDEPGDQQDEAGHRRDVGDDHHDVAQPAANDEFSPIQGSSENGMQRTGVDFARDGAHGQEQGQKAGQVVDDIHAEERQRGEGDAQRQTTLRAARVFKRLVKGEVEAEREEPDIPQTDQHPGQNQPSADRLLEGEARDLQDVGRTHLVSS